MTEYTKELEADAKRLDWLLKQGVAWRGCYVDDWKEGEWLYDWQCARDSIDDDMNRLNTATDKEPNQSGPTEPKSD